MTPTKFRDIRKALGLTQAQLAEVLGYGHAVRVAEFEGIAGKHPVPPLLDRLMRAYEAGYRPRNWPKV
ncbi:hypothetical protein NKJ06_18860 [Mesorhizobium sp. M0293]|uniref:helix-turn-helix domain-containing protein n=1 Tax=Mesorhizobium sp. M0293 TaxID=2956930 RepID=UPI003338C1A0